jgi:hypothetical protein
VQRANAGRITTFALPNRAAAPGEVLVRWQVAHSTPACFLERVLRAARVATV